MNKLSVYDGQAFLGSISTNTNGHTAFDVAGELLGVFQTRTEAQSAVLLAQRENKSGGMPIDEVEPSTGAPK